MNGAAAPEAVMGQIGNGIDQAGQFYFVILLILQRGWIKNRRSKHCGFSRKEIPQATYCQPCNSSFFLWIHLHNLLSI